MSATRVTKFALAVIALAFSNAKAQRPDSVRSAGAIVSGVVRDSIALAPLAGATVQIVSADDPARFLRSTQSDAAGRFVLADIPPGNYRLGFFHPLLDSIGVELPLREVTVDNLGTVETELAVPSPARIRSVICGGQPSDEGAVLVGTIRDARDGSPAKDVNVASEWLEYSFANKSVSRQTRSLNATTGRNGWFAMCNLPVGGSVALIATRGADSTGVIEIQIPAAGFVHRDFYLGAMRTASDARPAAESKRVLHVGDGRLSGTVVRATNGIPLLNAIVRVSGGPETRTNERGEWSIGNAPLGTRTLEVRALGYYPERRNVDIVGDLPPMDIELSTVQEVLDTVMIRAKRIYTRGDNGFNERRHSGVGRYMTADQIARRPAEFTSDIFRTLTGVRIGFASDTLATDMVLAPNPDDIATVDKRILIRGISGDWCAPAIYLDGTKMPQLGASDIDAWVRPKDVAAIEIYTEATVPPEFNDFRSGCGSIVIWRKDPFAGRKTPQR